ncbi:MAG: M3 family oligoendopeptidase [Clostridia bacterium]|nr:M3 family oligoendopeptidase [Clostridia bacterium]
MKVSQIKYVRPEKDDIIAKINETKEKFLQAKSVEEFLEIHKQFKKESNAIETMASLASIRFTLNTADEFYAKEQDYYDEVMPEIIVALSDLNRCYVESPFRKQLEEHFPKVMFQILEMQIKASDPIILQEKVEENKVCTEYTRLMSEILVDYNGEQIPFPSMSKYFANEDREVRKSAIIAYAKAIEDRKDQLDEIFDRLVKIRTTMGKKLGFENFSDLGYLRMQRTCYSKKEIAQFRENVKKYLVPLASKLRAKVQKEMGWDVQHYWDNGVYTKVEPKPFGTVDQIFEHGRKMYHEMDKATGELFDKMYDAEAFDVISRKGKFGGGYCTCLPDYKLPFILANFNGSLGDIDVLTHEFGHAYAFARACEMDCMTEFAMETAEVHSMSMEFLAYPWIEGFFGDCTPEYKFNHIGGALCFIPYGTIVDYFQQQVYDNPDMTCQERNDFYNKIEKEFLPHMTTEGIPAFENGRRWQRQQHIYESPFYYIDYCLAQFTALQFLALSQRDWKGAFEKYKKFVHINSDLDFCDTLKACDLLSPFEEESFKEVVKAVEDILKI